MLRKLILFMLTSTFLLACKEATQTASKPLSGYLQSLTKAPVKFETDVISTGGIEYNSSLSFAHDEFYFSMAAPDFSFRNMMVSKYRDGQFEVPEKVLIGGIVYDASDVQISKDGSYLYFKMRGNVAQDTTRRDGNVWRSKRTADVWAAAEMLPEEVNSALSEYYPIVTNSGNIYFSRETDSTSYDIYCSKLVEGKYKMAKPLPGHINTDLLESDAYIAPDESYMIFVRMYADDGMGVSDLYISFNENGTWSHPKNMQSLNSPGVDGSPYVTPDQQYLFFTSTRDSDNPEVFDGHLDIYAVKFDVNNWKSN